LKEVRYVPQFKRNFIFVSALKALGLEVSIRDGVLKMIRGSMVVLKNIRCNNLYYLKVTRQATTFINPYDDCTRLWHMRLGQTGKKYLQVLAKQSLLEGVKPAS